MLWSRLIVACKIFWNGCVGRWLLWYWCLYRLWRLVEMGDLIGLWIFDSLYIRRQLLKTNGFLYFKYYDSAFVSL